MPEITLKRADVQHVAEIIEVMESAYRGVSSQKGWTSEADLIDGTRTSTVEIFAAINDPKTYVLVAMTEGDGVVGCASITFEGQVCSFGKFAVDPSRQAGGIGKLLLAAAEQVATRNFGVSIMKMLVIDGRSELEAFYERRGYARTGNIVHMADLHTSDDMTIGHDLVLNEYAKSLIFRKRAVWPALR